jgi:hypothetical protein
MLAPSDACRSNETCAISGDESVGGDVPSQQRVAAGKRAGSRREVVSVRYPRFFGTAEERATARERPWWLRAWAKLARSR